MINKYKARTVAIEQICDFITAQIRGGWADDYFLDGEFHNSEEDINIIAQEAEKIVQLLEKMAVKRHLKNQ